MNFTKLFPKKWLLAVFLIGLTAFGFAVYANVLAQQPDPDETRQTLMARQNADAQMTENLEAISAITPCVGGMAGIYPCMNIDLMAFMPLADIGAGNSANDIWGWTDPLDGKEYALVGLSNGTSFVDVTDPENPVYLGRLPTQTSNSTWRDIKVHNDYAFIVSEAGGHGMQVFDLTRLRNVITPPEIFTVDAHYDEFGNAHNIAINEDSGFAYAIGTSTCSGGLHMVNIQTPLTPTNAGCYSSDGYTHDTQCVIYNGPDADYQGNEICFSSNEDTLTITDVTNKASPITVSITPYAGAEYTHQGWLTEDHAFFLLGDELDEANFGHPTRTRIWDVADLVNPTIIGVHDGPNSSIDHNMYTHNGNVYQSNYTSGLQIYDLADVANGNLALIAYFDSYPANNNANFDGSWSNYPYFTSGTVVHTGIDEGLFITRPVLEPTFALTTPDGDLSVCVAGDVSMIVDVHDQNGYTGMVSLSALDLPGGSTASFDPNPVTAPGSSTMTMTVTTTPAGNYPFSILGDDSILTSTVDASLTIFAGLPVSPTLLTPTQGETGVDPMPTFTWTGGDAESYLIEIATDPGFNNLVESAVVYDTIYTATNVLQGSSTYYWRVTAQNACGAIVSETFSFVVYSLVCSSPSIAIPDNDPIGANDSVTLTNTDTLQDVNVYLKINHNWVGDLKVTLTHQDTGTTITLVDRPGLPATQFGCSGNNIQAWLDDEAEIPVEDSCGPTNPTIFGEFVPQEPLNALDGEALAGTWVLEAADLAQSYTGTLVEWCLEPFTGPIITPTPTPTQTPSPTPTITPTPPPGNEYFVFLALIHE